MQGQAMTCAKSASLSTWGCVRARKPSYPDITVSSASSSEKLRERHMVVFLSVFFFFPLHNWGRFIACNSAQTTVKWLYCENCWKQAFYFCLLGNVEKNVKSDMQLTVFLSIFTDCFASEMHFHTHRSWFQLTRSASEARSNGIVFTMFTCWIWNVLVVCFVIQGLWKILTALNRVVTQHSCNLLWRNPRKFG